MGLIRSVANSPTPPQGGAARMLWGLSRKGKMNNSSSSSSSGSPAAPAVDSSAGSAGLNVDSGQQRESILKGEEVL